MDRRPSRRNHLRKLIAYSTPSAVPILMDLLGAPSAIETLNFEVDRLKPLSVPSPVAAIGRGSFSRQLAHLTVDVERTTESELYACLCNTPNLLSLTLRLIFHALQEKRGWGYTPGDAGGVDEGPGDVSGAVQMLVSSEADTDEEVHRARKLAAVMAPPKLRKLDITAKE